MRHRKQGGNGGELIDEDEQDQIVNTLEEEVTNQINQSNRFASIIGYLAVILNIILAVLNPFAEMNVLLWAHATVSSGFHLYSTLSHAVDTTKDNQHDISLVVLAILSCLLLAILGADHPMFDLHFVLFIGNLLTTSFAVWLRRDSMATLCAIHELEAAKYKYKSL